MLVYIYATMPIYYPATDIQVGEVEIRIHPSGDDQRYWGVHFEGSDDHWHPVTDAAHVLAHIEKTAPGTWGEILRAA